MRVIAVNDKEQVREIMMRQMDTAETTFKPDLTTAEQNIDLIFETGYVFAVYDDFEGEEVMVGTCGAFIDNNPVWYSNEKVLTEAFVYVDASHRQGKVADLLIDTLKCLAETLGLRLNIGHTQQNPKLMDRYFQKHGFTRYGGLYVV